MVLLQKLYLIISGLKNYKNNRHENFITGIIGQSKSLILKQNNDSNQNNSILEFYNSYSEYSLLRNKKLLLSYLYSLSIPKNQPYKYYIDNTFSNTNLYILYINGIATNEHLLLNSQKILTI